MSSTRSMAWTVLWAAGALWGCPAQGPVCFEGQTPCGARCVDLQSDSADCGACGTRCAEGQGCEAGRCVCQQGAQRCGERCVDSLIDPEHCGQCGAPCPAHQLCEAGRCVAGCEVGTRCGGSCVDLANHPSHCGGCGRACAPSQSCRQGLCTYDVVAACFSNGQLVGIQEGSYLRGSPVGVGSGPAALGVMGHALLVVDGLDQRLYSVRLRGVSELLAPLPGAPKTGAVPNQVWVDSAHLFIPNAGSGSVQVLERVASAEVEGLGLTTIAELPLGPNTYPEGVAKLGDRLFIPLYGGFGAVGAAAGQKVVEVDVADPRHPKVVHTFDLGGLDLRPFDGGSPVARPYAVALHRGKVYVTLNNLHPDSYAPQGPGLLARIDPVSRALEVLDLGADRCLNPIWLASDGSRLFVACQGHVQYAGPPNFEVLSALRSGVLLLDEQDQVVASWSLQCPAEGGSPDAGTRCLPGIVSRLAVKGERVYVGDQNGGRLFVLDSTGNQLREVRGFSGSGPPIQACAVNPVTGVSNVSDVLVVP